MTKRSANGNRIFCESFYTIKYVGLYLIKILLEKKIKKQTAQINCELK